MKVPRLLVVSECCRWFVTYAGKSTSPTAFYRWTFRNGSRRATSLSKIIPPRSAKVFCPSLHATDSCTALLGVSHAVIKLRLDGRAARGQEAFEKRDFDRSRNAPSFLCHHCDNRAHPAAPRCHADFVSCGNRSCNSSGVGGSQPPGELLCPAPKRGTDQRIGERSSSTARPRPRGVRGFFVGNLLWSSGFVSDACRIASEICTTDLPQGKPLYVAVANKEWMENLGHRTLHEGFPRFPLNPH